MAQTLTGGCQCGRVRYEVPAEMAAAGKCHCEQCRKSTGTGAVTVAVYPEDDVKITGETKSYSYTADSGNVTTSHFCGNCGSKVYLTNPASFTGLRLVMAGTLDDSSSVKPQFVVFAGGRPAWDGDDPSIPHFPGMRTG